MKFPTTRRVRVRLAAGSLVVLALAVAGIAYANIPDSNGVIYACYAKNGALRVIDSAAKCRPGETPLDWSHVGPTGATGPTGSAGTNGVSGYGVVRHTQTYNAPFSPDPVNLNAEVDCPDDQVVTGGGGYVQYFNGVAFLRLGDMAYMRMPFEDVPRSYEVAANTPPAGVTKIVVHVEAYCITALG